MRPVLRDVISFSATWILALGVIGAGFSLPAGQALAQKKGKKSDYHCEMKKNGKTVDDASIKTRKECKKKGGKWVKAHDDHDHGHDGEDHEHED